MEQTLRGEINYRIIVIEDDPQVAKLLGRQLSRYGYGVSLCQDFEHVDTVVRTENPDLVLLDINLPFYDGFYWCRRIRRFSTVPVIYISSRDGDMDQVFGLDNGGDEFITKPFQLEVLIAKIKALLRRTCGEYAVGRTSPREVYSLRTMKLDVRRATVDNKGKSSFLSKTELELLRRLLDAQGAVVSRNALLEAIWDDTHFVDDNTLTVNVTRLRQKLENVGIHDAIVTLRGVGYRFALFDECSPPEPRQDDESVQ
ncbi:MAG: response regulator transcription factor [Alicyclobacillaceae bacterium]|nr:response regulator transcription factor [Alicyclobacillaceae bacterium]